MEKQAKNNNLKIIIPIVIVASIIIVAIIIGGISKIITTKQKQKIKNEEVSINGAYIIDYADKNDLGDKNKAIMVVIFDIKPSKSLLLEKANLIMKMGDKTIDGKSYSYSDRILYDAKESIEPGYSCKMAYAFVMEKYLYKENEIFDIQYDIGTQKGEFSYVIKGETTLSKEEIKEVDFLEDIIKGTYTDNASDALMILSLKWKINDVYEKYSSYKKLDSYNKITYQSYGPANRTGKKILNYFTEGASNNISISNIGFLNIGTNEPIKYDLPALDYDVIERYYPGIKEHLIELDKVTKKGAEDLMSIEEGMVLPGSVISDVALAAEPVKKLLDNY